MWTAVAASLFWQHQRNGHFSQRAWWATKEDPKTEPKAPAWGKHGALFHGSIWVALSKDLRSATWCRESVAWLEVASVACCPTPSLQHQEKGPTVSQPGHQTRLSPRAPSPYILQVSLSHSFFPAATKRPPGAGAGGWWVGVVHESPGACFLCSGEWNPVYPRQLSVIIFTFGIDWHSRMIKKWNEFPLESFNIKSWLG